MVSLDDYQEHLEELRESVRSRCVVRREGNPPCSEHGQPCDIELHMVKWWKSVAQRIVCSWIPISRNSTQRFARIAHSVTTPSVPARFDISCNWLLKRSNGSEARRMAKPL